MAAALAALLKTVDPWDDTEVAGLVQPQPVIAPALAPLEVDLQPYDQLLTEMPHGA